MEGLMFYSFKLDEVSVQDNDFAPRKELVKKYMKEFDTDRLMHTFRINAGIASNALPLGGWESPDCGLRGHFVGHFLSACCKFAFGDHDEVLKKKATQIVTIMEQCAKPTGYLSAFPEEVLDTLEQEENRNVWAPYYTLHKILQGLIDSYRYIKNEKALQLAMNLARYIYKRFKKLSYWRIDGILHCTRLNPVNEFGGIGDALYTLYELTGENFILELAKVFDRDYFIEKLVADEDILENLHANTHLPMILAAIHRYEITGEEKYKVAASHFYQFLLGRSFANGNNSSKATDLFSGRVSKKSEHWGACGFLADALTGGESECCCAHNTEKLLEKLITWSESVEYLNHMERLKYNAVLNSVSSKTGLSQYHQPLGSVVNKKFSEFYDSFWCCTASGVEALSEIQKNIYFRKKDSILINDFIASSVIWKEKNIKITQTTAFPDELKSVLYIEADEPVLFQLLLKSESVKTVKVNSIEVKGDEIDGYLVIKRTFCDGDQVEIDINARLQLVPLQGSEELGAVMYGNILLAQIGETSSLQGINQQNIEKKLKRVSERKLLFEMESEGRKIVRFIPLFRVEEETYTVYMDLTGTSITREAFSFAENGSAAY